MFLLLPSRHCTPRACGIIGIHRQSGSANAELYEGLLSLQHRGQASRGAVRLSCVATLLPTLLHWRAALWPLHAPALSNP